MSRTGVVRLVTVLALAMTSGSTGEGQGSPEVVLTVDATCKGSYHVKEGEVSILSADGGGTILDPSGVLASSWTYRIDPQPTTPLAGFGTMGFPRGAASVFLESVGPYIKPTDERGGQAAEIVDSTFSDARSPVGSSEFERQLVSSFPPNSTTIAVSGQASHTYVQPVGFTGHLEVHYSITGGDSNLLEAVIIPQENYDSWLPEAGADETTPGNQIVVSVRLRGKGAPNKPPDKNGRFRFVLSNVSHETGVCLNYPLKSAAKALPDLKIDKQANPDLDVDDDGQGATSKRPAESDTITITSYDFGAYGRLSVTALLDGGGVR